MDIDETGADCEAVGIRPVPGSGVCQLPDRRDPSLIQTHVGPEPGAPRPVENSASGQKPVKHCGPLV